ncbi:putative Pirin family proteins [Tenacibaculum xiamenense]
MDRKKFIKKSLIGSAVALLTPSLLKGENDNKDLKKHNNQVGFNHIPNNEITTMKTVLHKANTRGKVDLGWLKANHSFSFANYYNPDRMNFGALRVLNDDTIAGGKGFGMHPHQNMEIVSIPLEGDLEHKDSMGNVGVINEGDIQAMSAGKGIYHSEYNKNSDKEVKLLQIWIHTKKQNIAPQYDQISIRELEKKNKFYQILSPYKNDQGVTIIQDSWFHIGKFNANATDSYTINKKGNGVYCFVIEGNVEIEGQTLEKRDGFGIWDTETIQFKSNTSSKVLLIEVPMNVD